MWGTGPRAAARQAAALFALAGALAGVGILNDPARSRDFLLIAGADLAVAAFAWAAPWQRWPGLAPAALCLPAFVVLGFSTWAVGGVATGTGPFLVLIFAWAALHFPAWLLIGLSAPALVAYVVPLVVTDQPPAVLGSAAVVLPVAVGIALLISAQARHLRHDRERIGRIERWRAALAAALAHDVRSPLATVQMVLEELREGAEPTTRAELVDTAMRQVVRINRLAAGLLDMDRIETRGELRLDRRPVVVREAVRQAVRHLPEVEIDVPHDLVVRVDLDRFEQILLNLVTNGVRHGEPPVVVRVTADAAVTRLEVRDHGPGVPPAARERLFTRFGSDDPESVGLGLWIVGQLARAFGGTAHYEDAAPGARMVVVWPGGREAGRGVPVGARPAVR